MSDKRFSLQYTSFTPQAHRQRQWNWLCQNWLCRAELPRAQLPVDGRSASHAIRGKQGQRGRGAKGDHVWH